MAPQNTDCIGECPFSDFLRSRFLEQIALSRVLAAGQSRTNVMDSNSRGILLGVALGLLFVIGVVVLGFNWGTDTIKTAALPIEPPIMFQPK
jgi:hypothetical protein